MLTLFPQRTRYLGRIHGATQQEIVARLLQGHQETSVFRKYLRMRFLSSRPNLIYPSSIIKIETEGIPRKYQLFPGCPACLFKHDGIQLGRKSDPRRRADPEGASPSHSYVCFLRPNRTPQTYFHQLMSDLPAPYSLPEFSASTGTSKITLKLPGTGVGSTLITHAATSTPVKGGSVMLRVPGLPKDPGATATNKAIEPETSAPASSTNTRSRAAKDKAATTESTLIQPTLSTSKAKPTKPPRTTPTTVQTTSPVQNYSTHYPNAPYRQPANPRWPTSAAPSTARHPSTSYTPTTILPTYPAYTGPGYSFSTSSTPLNPLSNSNNYKHTYGGPGFGPGATGTTPYSTANGISYANAVCP